MDKRPGEKKDDDEAFIPFQGLEKGIVLQEKRIFNDTPLNPKKCCQLLTKLLYLVVQGDKFTKTEATEVFFSVTKLFQSKDIPLRRMVYLVLKELTPLADDVIIVMSSLTKDMNSKTDIYRANAIRVLTGITDSALLGQVERYLKQAIVDKDQSVSSAALVSGAHLIRTSPEIVKRWVAEVQEALQSKHPMVQYHALGLLHQIKQHDRLAVSKLVQSMTKTTVRSPYAHCLLIKFAATVMEEDTANAGVLYNYLESCLRHKSDIVIYEAARAICNLKNVTARDLTPAITMLQLSLSNPKPAIRFAAVRTLNKVAQTHPLSVTTCNLDLENLITDSNRSIATLAITTLLKTGSESSVDRLMKQITNFMGEISDEFKVVVVDAIRTLCLKFPQKQRTMLSFLSNILRDEGGFEYKKSIVESILTIIKEIPEAKEAALTHLCEFIEDCEFSYLSTKILHLLGKEGPSTSVPSRYIRYIYNRISLENASVRASAVSALAKFAIKLETLRPSIVVLLRRCLYDNDDEVRDRATFYLRILEKDKDNAARLLTSEFVIPLANLERSLEEYQKNAGNSTAPFDITRVPLQPIAVPKKAQTPAGTPSAASSSGIPSQISKPTAADSDLYSALLASIPQFSSFGPLFKSSKPTELTESETEYVVNVVKHVFAEHMVFQFNCTNTLQDVVLEKISVKMDVNALKGAKVVNVIPLDSLPYGTPGITYVAVKMPKESIATGTCQNTLKFVTKEIDPSTGEPEDTGNEDEYQLEDCEVTVSDYVRKLFAHNWQEKWDEIGDEFEAVETYALSTMKSLQDAVKEITDFLGMQACDRTDQAPGKKTKHILLLSGEFLGAVPVMARSRMKFVEGQGVQMELTIRSKSDDVSIALAGAI